MEVKVTQSCPTLCDPTDYIVHGILQARILEWVAVPFSRASTQPRVRTQVCPHCRQILYQLSHKGKPKILEWVAYPFFSRSSPPRNWTGVSCIAGRFFTSWATRVSLSLLCIVWTVYICQSQSLGASRHHPFPLGAGRSLKSRSCAISPLYLSAPSHRLVTAWGEGLTWGSAKCQGRRLKAGAACQLPKSSESCGPGLPTTETGFPLSTGRLHWWSSG